VINMIALYAKMGRDTVKAKHEQLSILPTVSTPTQPTAIGKTELLAKECFWKIHQYHQECGCPVPWWKWEEHTGGNIWNIS
jgi:hypothetical protein